MKIPVKKGSGLVVVESAPLRYVLSLPPAEASDGESLPLLCFLHGDDEAAPLDIRTAVTRHGPLRPGSWPGATQQFIIVAPQLPAPGDTWYRYAEAVGSIVTDVRITHGGDPTRSYLTGFSFGGNGVFDLAEAWPSFWAALWAVDPTRVPREDPGRPVWLSFGDTSRYLKKAFARTLSLALADAAPGGDRVFVDQGMDHVGTAGIAYQEPRIYEWLLSKQLTYLA